MTTKSVSQFIKLRDTGFKVPVDKGWNDPDKKDSRIKFSELNQHKNIGFVPPEGYIVIDCDDKEAIANVEKLNSILNKAPFSYDTSKGRHYVYRKPFGKYFDEIVSSASISIFVKSEEKYKNSKIDAKGSHKNVDGKWRAGQVCVKAAGIWRVEPDEMINAFNDNAPICPLSLLVKSTMRFSIDEYTEGNRDDYMFKSVAKFRSNGWTKEQFETLWVEVSRFKDDKENIDEVVEWASQKWESSVRMGKVEKLGIAAKEEKESSKEGAVSYWSRFLEANGFTEEDNHKLSMFRWEKLPVDKQKFGSEIVYRAVKINKIYELSKLIIEETKLQYSEEDNQLWGMQLGEFKHITDIKHFIKRWLVNTFKHISTNVMNEIESYIVGSIPFKKFDDNQFIASFKNCNYDVFDGREVYLKGDVMSQNTIPHKLITNGEMRSEEYKEAVQNLKNAMHFWSNKNVVLEKQIYERVGLAFIKYTGFEKAFFLYGIGNNGKSAFLRLLINALGTNNVSHEDLKELSTNEFSSSNLYCKLANINLDISSNVIEDPSLFKKLVSGDNISGSYKGKNKFNFKPYATQFFGANNIPYARERGDSDAINRRIEIIPFSNTVKKEISEKEKVKFNRSIEDEKLIEVFIRKSIDAVNKALNKGFTTSALSIKILEEVQREFNDLYDFIEESGIVQNESTMMSYERYLTWAKKNRIHSVLGRKEFVKKYINVARQKGIFIHKERYEGTTSKRHRLIMDNIPLENEE